MVKESYSEMLSEYDRPIKFYRTMQEAFKDADYACALEVSRDHSKPSYAVGAWVSVVLILAMLAIFITG